MSNKPLSPEEQKQLQELEAQFGAEADAAADHAPQYLPHKETIGGQEFIVNEQVEDPTFARAMQRSGEEGFLFKLSGEVNGFYDTVMDKLFEEDNHFMDFSAMYHKNKDLHDAARERGERRWGKSTFAIEAVGSALSAVATGGLGLGALTVKGAAALGALTGFGGGDVRDPEGLIKSTAIGGAIGGATQGLLNKYLPGAGAKAAQAVAKTPELRKKQADIFLESLGVNSKANGLGSTEQGEILSNMLKRRGEYADTWAARAMFDSNGEHMLTPGINFQSLLNKTQDELAIAKNMIMEPLTQADVALQRAGVGGVDVDLLMSKLSNDIIEPIMYGQITPEMQKRVARELKPYMSKTHMSFSEIQQMNIDLGELVSSYSKANPTALSGLAWNAKRIIKDFIKTKLSTVDDTLTEKYIAGNTRYGDMATLEDMLMKPAAASHMPALRSIKEAILSGAKRAAFYSVSGSVPGMVGTAASALRSIFVGGNAAGLGAKRMASVQKIINGLEAAPGLHQELANRLIIAATKTTDLFEHELGYVESAIELTQNPVQRTTEDLIQKMPQVLNVVRDSDPGTYSALLKSLQDNDKATTREIMSTLSKTPQGQKMVVGGEGWDGVAASKMDYDMAVGRIKNSRQNTTVKMRQLRQLDMDGTLPLIQEYQAFMRQPMRTRRNANNQKIPKF